MRSVSRHAVPEVDIPSYIYIYIVFTIIRGIAFEVSDINETSLLLWRRFCGAVCLSVCMSDVIAYVLMYSWLNWF